MKTTTDKKYQHYFTKKVEDKEIRKIAGLFIEDDTDYELIDKECEGYDSETKEFLFTIKKKCFDNNIIENYDDIRLGYNTGRGGAGGIIDLEVMKKLYGEKSYKIVGKKKNGVLFKKKDGTYSKYIRKNPVKSNIIGFFDYQNYIKKDGINIQVRNIKTTRYTNAKTLNALKELTLSVDKKWSEIMPEYHQGKKDYLKEIGFKEHLYNTTLFSTITLNENLRCGLHQDGYNYANMAIMAVLGGEKGFEGGELYLPKYKLKLKLEPGDLILFKNKEWHTNAPLKDKKNSTRFSFVFYIRDRMVEFYDKTKDTEVSINKSYNEDLFIDYEKKAILLNVNGDKYNKYKKEITDYSKKNNLNIYRMSEKTSLNRRKFGDWEIRYIDKKELGLFKNPIFLKDIVENT
jgi:hypothetical protein